MSKKVAVLLDNSFKSDNRVEKSLNSLVNAGCIVTLYCEISENLPEKEHNPYAIERIFKPSYKKIFSNDFKKIIVQLADTILASSPDVIYCNDLITLNIGRVVKEKNDEIVLIYDAHEYFRGLPYYKNAKGLLGKFKGALFMRENLKNEAIGIKKADFAITASLTIAKKLYSDYQLPEVPTRVLNVPCKMVDKSSSNIDLKEMLGLVKSDILIAQIGGIYVSDAVHNQFLTICGLNNFKCVFIGNTKKHQKLKRQFKNSSSFFVHTYASQLENIKVLKNADIGLFIMDQNFLSYKLTNPNRYFEYAFAGLPIISFESVGLKEITDHFPNTVYINNLKQLPKAVNYCLKNKESLQKESEKIRRNYNWEKEFSKILTFLAINSDEKLFL